MDETNRDHGKDRRNESGDAAAQARGVLRPNRLPTFTRVAPPSEVADLVRWFWIPEWDLPVGHTSRQQLLGFPASNLVVQNRTAVVSGPTTRTSHQDLSGKGWAIGALLLPAAVPTLAPEPATLRDQVVPRDLPDLINAVTVAWESASATRTSSANERPNPTSSHSPDIAPTPAPAQAPAPAAQSTPAPRQRAAVEAFGEWLLKSVPRPSEDDLLANKMALIIDSDPEMIRVEQVAQAIGVSVRKLQRLAQTHVGVSPAAMIRRRRLQAAAERVREDPNSDLAAIAADLGYSDHAHLSRDFHEQLGFTPSAYRSEEVATQLGRRPG